MDLYLQVNNTGASIVDIRPVKLSIFRDDHWHYFTFGLLPSDNFTLGAFSNVSLEYNGDRTLDTIEGITFGNTITAYGRVLIRYENDESIVTTSLFEGNFPIE